MGSGSFQQPQILYSSTSGVGGPDCDCACVPHTPRRVPPEGLEQAWVAVSPPFSLPLEEGWQAFFNPSGPATVVVLNPSARAIMRYFSTPSLPKNAPASFPTLSTDSVIGGIRELVRAGLLQPEIASGSTGAIPSATLTIWLHLTYACNLRCPYCYVSKQPQQMSESIALAAVERSVQIARQYGYHKLRLKYAGGEPTLNFPVLRAAHLYATRRTAELGLDLEAVLLTNGVQVTEEMLDFVAGEGIRLSVSLDGGPESHHRLRSSGGGTSTYEAVVRTIEQAIGRGILPHISITLTALNLDGAVGGTRFAVEHGLPFNLNFYRELSSSSTSLLRPKGEDLIRALRKVFALLESYLDRYPYPLTGILDRSHFDVPHAWACAAGRDYLVVDPRGNVAPCQMLISQPWASIETDNLLATVRCRGEALFGPSVDDQPDCRTCPWRYACGGGCPLLRGTTLHSEYCRVYQALYPELVKLEGQRLVRQRHLASPAWSRLADQEEAYSDASSGLGL